VVIASSTGGFLLPGDDTPPHRQTVTNLLQPGWKRLSAHADGVPGWMLRVSFTHRAARSTTLARSPTLVLSGRWVR